MTSSRLTNYAPDVYRSLSGILLIHKPAKISYTDLVSELRERITDSLNQLQPRPLATRMVFQDEPGGGQKLAEVTNLADHPLVVGPRYLPWEVKISPFLPILGPRSSGLQVFILGDSIKYFPSSKKVRLANIYHLSGKFGYITDNGFDDGKIMDRTTIRHITYNKIDHVLSKIETTQRDRLFDAANVPITSQEAYELAKAWPSRPPRMAHWPVIYRIRCIHLELPSFKLEVSVVNETESFLAELCHDVGLMLKTGAYTEAIRRVKLGPFSIDDSLTEKEWDLQSIVNNLSIYRRRYGEIQEIFRRYRKALAIRNNYSQRLNNIGQDNSQKHIETG